MFSVDHKSDKDTMEKYSTTDLKIASYLRACDLRYTISIVSDRHCEVIFYNVPKSLIVEWTTGKVLANASRIIDCYRHLKADCDKAIYYHLNSRPVSPDMPSSPEAMS